MKRLNESMFTASEKYIYTMGGREARMKVREAASLDPEKKAFC